MQLIKGKRENFLYNDKGKSPRYNVKGKKSMSKSMFKGS